MSIGGLLTDAACLPRNLLVGLGNDAPSYRRPMTPGRVAAAPPNPAPAAAATEQTDALPAYPAYPVLSDGRLSDANRNVGSFCVQLEASMPRPPPPMGSSSAASGSSAQLSSPNSSEATNSQRNSDPMRSMSSEASGDSEVKSYDGPSGPPPPPEGPPPRCQGSSCEFGTSQVHVEVGPASPAGSPQTASSSSVNVSRLRQVLRKVRAPPHSH